LIPAEIGHGRDKHFERRISCTGSHTRQTRIDTVTSFFNCDDRVRDTEAQVVVRVYARLRLGFERFLEGSHAILLAFVPDLQRAADETAETFRA
jgi:hypothetical protein